MSSSSSHDLDSVVVVQNKPGTTRQAVYATRDIQAGEVIGMETPLLIFDPRNNQRIVEVGARDKQGHKPLAVSTLEMQLPALWVSSGKTDKELHKLGLCDKTTLLPEDEFLQVGGSPSLLSTRSVRKLRQSSPLTPPKRGKGS
jgi:hypothetical protein